MTSLSEKPKAIEWLLDQFPKAFFQKANQVKPLKLGILDDIIEFYDRLEEPPFSKKQIREAVNYYSSSKSYLNCQKPNASRINLFGQLYGKVETEQAAYAEQRLQERHEARQTIKKLASTSLDNEAVRVKGE